MKIFLFTCMSWNKSFFWPDPEWYTFHYWNFSTVMISLVSSFYSSIFAYLQIHGWFIWCCLHILILQSRNYSKKNSLIELTKTYCQTKCLCEIFLWVKVYHSWKLTFLLEGLKGLHKTFWGTTKKCENKHFSLRSKLGREGLIM